MKKYFIIPFLLFSSLYAYPRCTPDLQNAVKTIYRLPAGKELIEQVEREGAITICRAPFRSGSPAMWVGDDRTIVINANSRRPFGEVVRSILFELHNAKRNRDFEQLDRLAENRQISKNEYVEATERIEHENATHTVSLLRQGIQQGYFPSNSWWCIPADFETHYRIQKEMGHSANIAALYDAITHSNSYGCRH